MPAMDLTLYFWPWKMFSACSMFSEEVYLDLLCSSFREPESEPWEPYDYTWSRSRFLKRSEPEPFFKNVIRLSNTGADKTIWHQRMSIIWKLFPVNHPTVQCTVDTCETLKNHANNELTRSVTLLAVCSLCEILSLNWRFPLADYQKIKQLKRKPQHKS